MTRDYDPFGIAIPAGAPRPPRRGAGADRAFAANVLGTLALTVTDRMAIGAARAVRHGANAPAALVTVLWYPDRPIAFLADRLRISHPGAVQLVDRPRARGPRWTSSRRGATCSPRPSRRSTTRR